MSIKSLSESFLIFVSLLMSLSAANPFLWKNRILIIQYHIDQKSAAIEQVAMFKICNKGMLERKMKVLSFEYTKKWKIASPKEESFLNKVVWFKRFALQENDFQLSLMGLDGGLKKTWKKPIQCVDLFKVIDSMPMRQFELKQ